MAAFTMWYLIKILHNKYKTIQEVLNINVQLLLLTIVSVICYSGAAISDLYSWTDENGSKHYATSPPPPNQANVTITKINKSSAIVKPAKTIKRSSKPTKVIRNEQLSENEKKEIDKEIQGVWNGMWDALKKGDAGKASEYITPDSRKNYHRKQGSN